MSADTLVRNSEWEVTLDQIKVDRPCPRCFPGKKLDEIEIRLVSSHGVVHEGEDYGWTACKRDATGKGWWWAL
jgi:hypothetical protein